MSDADNPRRGTVHLVLPYRLQLENESCVLRLEIITMRPPWGRSWSPFLASRQSTRTRSLKSREKEKTLPLR